MLLQVLTLIAIAAEAMTAALTARRFRMDWFGVSVIGSIAGLGGGTVRDVLLGHYPLTWVRAPWLLLLTSVFALIGAALAVRMQRLRRLFLALDAMGLVVFTIGGCNIAHDVGMSTTVCVIFGMVSGCAGGVLRDVICNVVPLLFQRELYASVSAAVAVVYMSSEVMGCPSLMSIGIAMFGGLLLRGLALRYRWQMPSFKTEEGA